MARVEKIVKTLDEIDEESKHLAKVAENMEAKECYVFGTLVQRETEDGQSESIPIE